MERIEVLRAADDAEQIREGWENLAEHSAEKNCFYEIDLIVPALRHLNKDRAAAVICVWNNSDLIGVFPVERKRKWHGLPVPHLSLWQHRHCYLTTPLVHKDYLERAIGSFASWLESRCSWIGVFDFEFVSSDGPFFPALEQAVLNGRKKKLHVSGEFERAVFNVKGDFASYWQSLGVRRTLKKKFAKLEKSGALAIEYLGDPSHQERWAEEFLALEYHGWKGQAGTAMVCSGDDSRFFREAVARTAAAGRLLMQKMTFDGRNIAMRCSFRAQDTAFAFKIAYDESLREASPGLLLEIENVRYLLDQQSAIRVMDSCAAPRAPLFEHIWHDSRKIAAGAIVSPALNRVWQMRDVMAAARALRSRSAGEAATEA